MLELELLELMLLELDELLLDELDELLLDELELDILELLELEDDWLDELYEEVLDDDWLDRLDGDDALDVISWVLTLLLEFVPDELLHSNPLRNSIAPLMATGYMRPEKDPPSTLSLSDLCNNLCGVSAIISSC